MRLRKILILTVMLLGLACESAHARWRLFNRSSGGSNVGVEWDGPVGILEADQAACQYKAEYMAARNLSGHPLGLIGHFEGTGCGGCTCRPGSNMTLTGDGKATSINGVLFRVRSWR